MRGIPVHDSESYIVEQGILWGVSRLSNELCVK